MRCSRGWPEGALPVDFGERRADADRERRRRAGIRRRALGRRQAVVDDRRSRRHDVGAVDDIAQLAHVADPAMLGLAPQDLGREALLLAFTLCDLIEEMPGNQWHVFGAIAQRPADEWERR